MQLDGSKSKILCRFRDLSGACQKATALFGKEAENAANLLSASSSFCPNQGELSHFRGIIMGYTMFSPVLFLFRTSKR